MNFISWMFRKVSKELNFYLVLLSWVGLGLVVAGQEAGTYVVLFTLVALVVAMFVEIVKGYYRQYQREQEKV